MTEPDMTGGSNPGRKSSAWQPLLVLPALGSLGLGVMLPLWVLAVIASTALSLMWCGHRIEQLAFRSQELMLMSALVSGVLVLGGLGAAAWESLQETLHQSPEAKARARKGWLLRHPWWTLGLGLMLADGLLWRSPSDHPLAAASVLLAECSWFILTATWLAWRIAWGSLRLGWRLSRASSFLAGLVVAAGLFTAAGWSLFFQVAEELARSASPDLSRALQQSGVGGGWSPSRMGARLPTGTTAPAVPALFEHPQHGALTPGLVRFGDPGEPDEDVGDGYLQAQALGDEPPDAFSDCILGLDSRLRGEATSLAGRYVDSFEAQDVVQDVLIRVCLRGRAPSVFRGYFIRSVQNRALEWRRRAARVCALVEAPETSCALQPDEDYLREEQSRAINKALCALSEEEQEVLRLRFFEHEDYARIAAWLGSSEETARQRVSRARRKFRAAFQEKCL